MCGSPGAVKVSLRINSGENERVDFSGGGAEGKRGVFFPQIRSVSICRFTI